jgi:deoxyribodipyrimidine photolyase-related protein
MTTSPDNKPVRRLLVVLGDQLNRNSALFADFDPAQDLVWMCEAAGEATHVPSHRSRTVLFLSAMRHFRDALEQDGVPLRYLALQDHDHPGIPEALAADLALLEPERVALVQPGEYRLLEAIRGVGATAGVPVDVLDDQHFLCPLQDFAGWSEGRKELRLEYFYRWMRKRHNLLMDGDKPAGGAWNFDKDNRKTFGKRGPGLLPTPASFAPDEITRSVIAMVEERFPDAPGRCDAFDWPVCREQALVALADFIDHRLPAFGPFEDAMWAGEPYLYHSRLSAALNLKLLDPREVIAAAVDAFDAGRAPIASVEGFVRQILGWREYVRGIYWLRMPGYLEENALSAHAPLPGFFWTGETDYACLRDAVGQVVRLGYGHHIQRLMVTGLFSLLLGVEPKQIHAWYLAMFVDAVEWVETPNTLGMSQFADGGLLASKPYAASGAYISRMGNHCAACRCDPKEAVGDDACPFTTLFWDFLDRHRERFAGHPRTALMWRNLARIEPERLEAIRNQARELRRSLNGSTAP